MATGMEAKQGTRRTVRVVVTSMSREGKKKLTRADRLKTKEKNEERRMGITENQPTSMLLDFC